MAIKQGFNVLKGLINKLPKGKTKSKEYNWRDPATGELAPKPAPAKQNKALNLFFGGPKRTAATLIGAPFIPKALYEGGKGYVDILRSAYGRGEEPQQDQITDLELQRGSYNPLGTSQGMNPEDLLATINAFAQGMPAPAGGGGAGQRSVYETGSVKAQRALGFQPTSTSSLSPMAGGESLAAQALTNQRGSLQDYLNMVSSAANAAGVKLDQASRQQLVNLGLSAYIEDMQNQRQKAEALQYLPPFIVTPQVRAAAEERVATTPGLTLQEAVDDIKRYEIYTKLLEQNSR